MRLNGYFKAGPLEGAYVTVVVGIPKLDIRQNVELLIDTGATKTTILDRDAVTLGIPYSKLSLLRRPLLGLGGPVDTYLAKDAELYFKTTSDHEHKEQMRDLLVVRHKKVDENIMRVPSVLGRDILNKYHLEYDKRREVIVITDES